MHRRLPPPVSCSDTTETVGAALEQRLRGIRRGVGQPVVRIFCDDGQKTKSENSDLVSHGGDACGNLSPRLLSCRQRRTFLPPVPVSFGRCS
jgi:hypothetical protein